MGQPGGGTHLNGAVDGFLFSPVGASRGEIGGVRMAFGHELVLEVFDDVAAFAMELKDAAATAHQVHRLADVVVVAHPTGTFLVGHEHFEGLDAEVDGLGQTGQNAGPVLQDEMEGEVCQSGLFDGFASAMDGLRQCLVALQPVGAERYQGGQAGAGSGQRAQGVVVVPVQVDVAVDQAGKHELAGGVDVAIGRR